MNYLQDLFGPFEEGYIATSTFKPNTSHFFKLDDLENAAYFMKRRAQDCNIYFCNAVFAAPPTSGRGKVEDVIGLPMLFADVDIWSENPTVHKKNDLLFRSLDQFQELLKELGAPVPTSVRSSGNGYYADWVFDEPLRFGSAAMRETVAAESKRFQAALIEASKQKGFHLDPVGDLVRVTRLPGTLNHKTKPPKPVTLTEHRGERIAYADLMAWVSEAEKMLCIEQKAGGAKRGSAKALLGRKASSVATTNDGAEKEPRFESVSAGCRWAADCATNPGMSEPDWFALAGIVKRCENGREVYHAISRLDPRYDEAETESKLGRHGGPVRCETVAGQLGFAGCARCPFSAQPAMTSPIQLGRLSPAQAKLASEYVVHVGTGQFLAVNDDEVLSKEAFAMKFAHLFPKTNPTQALVKGQLTMKVDKMDYVPGEKPFFHKGSQAAFNRWIDDGIQPLAGDCSLILAHLEYLFPDENERAHFVNVLASLVQNPSAKVKHVLLLIGSQGSGKSFFRALTARMFGEGNVHAIEGGEIGGEWNARMANNRILFMEEMRQFEKRDCYDDLKVWISEEHVNVNEKFVPIHQARTPFVIFALSNFEVPISLPDGDRRFWVSMSPAKPRDGGYYKTLFTEGLDQAAAFLHHLGTVDLSGFNPDAPPPMTAAKTRIQEQSKPRLVQEIAELMSIGTAPFNKDLVTTMDVRLALFGRMSPVPDQRHIATALRELGAVPLPQTRLRDGSAPRPWAWKNQERWSEVSADERRQELERQ